MNIDATIAAIPTRTPAQRREMRANADRWFAKGTPAQQKAAREMIEALNAHEEAERQCLAERMTATPLAARVVEAFRVHPPTEVEAKVLLALLNNPKATSGRLSEACGWGGMIWHRHFGEIGMKRESYLWPAPRSEKRDANFWCGILADFDPDGSRWTMKPEVVVGLVEVGLAASGARV